MAYLTELDIESAGLAWLESLGWTVKHGPEIAPGELAAERNNYGQVILTQRLQDALERLTPCSPPKRWRTPSASSPAPRGRNSRRATAPSTACSLTASLWCLAIQKQGEGRGSTRRPGMLVAPGGSGGGGALRGQSGVKKPREGPGETHTFIRPCAGLHGQARF
jgi:hypothetical protein